MMETTKVSPEEMFSRVLKKSLQESYSLRHTKIVKAAMLKRCKEGYSVTKPPLGYTKTLEKGLFTTTEYGEGLGSLLQCFAEGYIELDSVIHLLQMRHGLVNKAEMSRSTALRIMSDPYYAGYVLFEGTTYPGKHKALISADQHQAILKQLQKSGYKAAASSAVE